MLDLKYTISEEADIKKSGGTSRNDLERESNQRS